MRKNKFGFNTKALSSGAANQILANVFAACGAEQNSVPLDTIMEYSNYRKERFVLQKGVIYVVLGVFLLLPTLFITGRVILSHLGGTASYEVYTDSVIPIKEVNVSMDDHAVAGTDMGGGVYQLNPTHNGEMQVQIVLRNNQVIDATIEVTTVDEEAPQLVSSFFDESYYYLTVRDTGSGINSAQITVQYEDGSEAAGWSYTDGTVKVPYPDRYLVVSVPDNSGNVLRLQLTPMGTSQKDTQAPTVEHYEFDSNYWYLYMSDNSSGVDFEKIAISYTNSGATFMQWYADENKSRIVVSFPDEDITLVVPDKAGNQLTVRLAPTK